MEYLDINGEILGVWDEVIVPDPNETDIHHHSFVGTVVKFRDNNAIVTDSDDNEFEVECNRLTLCNE